MFKRRVRIEQIATHKGMRAALPSEHLLFSVEGGTGKLRMAAYPAAVAEPPREIDYRAALFLGDCTLVRVQSNGCPTCESLLAAGYGLPEDSPELQVAREALSRRYEGLEDALERLKPLLGLLPTGIYVLSHSKYYPTDGDGRFFWDAPQELTYCKATAEIYDCETYRSLPCFPCFLFPTQGTEKFDPDRVEYYRRLIRAGELPPPVLAYALWGYMSALLDGHHRACACALEGVCVPCLTVSRPGQIWRERVRHIVWPDGSEAATASLLSPRQLRLLNQPDGAVQCDAPADRPAGHGCQGWSPAYEAAARRYPTCGDAGALALYPERELNAEGLRRLAMDEDLGDAVSAARLLLYAARQPGADGKGLGMAFQERGHPAVLRQAAFQVLDQIKDDPDIDGLMIQVLVDCERTDDPIYRIANGHWGG